MELIYLWVDGYKNLYNCGVILNSKYEQISEPIFSKNKLVLNLKESNTYDLFGDKLNILAIVGKNGSGKTNICNALSSIIRKNNKENSNKKKSNFKNQYDKNIMPQKYCLIYRESGKLYYFGNCCLELIGKENILEKNISNFDIAKFQPFLRIDDEQTLSFNQSDLALEYKLKNYFYYDRFRNDDENEALRELFAYKNLKLFKKNKYLRFDCFALEVDIRKKLEYFNANLMLYYNSTIKKGYNLKNGVVNLPDRLTRQNRSFLREVNSGKATLTKFINRYLPIMCFTNALARIYQVLPQLKETEMQDVIQLLNDSHNLKFGEKESRIDFYQNIFHKIKIEVKKPRILSYLTDWDIKTTKALIIKYLQYEIDSGWINKLIEDRFEKKLINKNILRINSDKLIDIDYYYLPPNDESNENLLFTEHIPDIFENNFYKKTPIDNEPYSFNDLSTGEQRILRFFADIVLINKSFLLKETQPFLYIFDEMDISWHPEWQRMMIDYILDIFENVTDENNSSLKNIIFLTHSPLILSDFPKNNVLLIDKDETTGNAIIMKSAINTFGANIHDLFNNNFFLDCKNGRTIGEFAKLKICEISDKLNSENELREVEIIDLEKAINIIGEPIIRMAFLRKLYSMPNYLSQNKTMEDLYAEITELKRKLNERN